MSLIRKLKPDRNITGPLIPLTMILIWGICLLIWDVPTSFIILAVLAGIYSLFYLIVFARTGNYAQLVIFLDFVFATAVLAWFTKYFDASWVERLQFRLAYLSGLVFFGFVLIYLALTRKLKWRGREIFELAAEAVEETGNGYTSRPRPVGKVEYSPQQMRSFARFCARHLIALPYYTSKNITLVPIKMGEEFGRVLGLSGDYRDASWVNFDVNGDVAVHIAHKDYLDYREPLAFDQLCASFGQVFIDFFDLYNKGEGVRVIDRMDDLKIGVFS
jgi:hypothetical protein